MLEQTKIPLILWSRVARHKQIIPWPFMRQSSLNSTHWFIQGDLLLHCDLQQPQLLKGTISLWKRKSSYKKYWLERTNSWGSWHGWSVGSHKSKDLAGAALLSCTFISQGVEFLENKKFIFLSSWLQGLLQCLAHREPSINVYQRTGKTCVLLNSLVTSHVCIRRESVIEDWVILWLFFFFILHAFVGHILYLSWLPFLYKLNLFHLLLFPKWQLN